MQSCEICFVLLIFGEAEEGQVLLDYIISFFAKWYSIAWTYHNLFVHLFL
jgi:hypothetical protein